MGAQGRDSHAHGRTAGICVHDLTGLVEHLHLLLRIPIVLEHVYLRNHIVGQLVSELIHRHRLAFYQLLILLLQLCHGRCAGTARTLVAGYVNTLDMAQILNWLKNNNHHDGRAVRVRDDAARTDQRILCIALGHDQWHIVVHTERAGVVYHHRAKLCDILSKFLGSSGTSRSERNVNAFEVVAMLQKLNLIFLSAEGVFSSGTTGGTEQHQFVNREISLIQYAQELLPYSTACANNRYFHKKFLILICM